MTARWDQIQDLYHRALARNEKERGPFLTDACAGDESLRQEVESLLKHHSEAQQALETPAVPTASEHLANAGRRIGIGRQIGSYKVVSMLGVGGMGEVYRAMDLKLGRDVAIKVLPFLFHSDSERVRRFEREARLLASLNHPNIAAIYGLEELDGAPSLVLELIEGPTLTERIANKPLPIKETLRIGRQIAEALETAHNRDIIHRDLKPANIKLTADGRVKVLDFGLGKSYGAQSAPQDLANSPTLNSSATAKGVILGTAAYMSPEQARGKIVDPRCDIWAFGCVLYEMLTGRQAFAGESVSETLAQVLAGTPDWSVLPVGTPPAAHSLLKCCLEKDPNRRLRSIGDARLLLEAIPETYTPPTVLAPSGILFLCAVIVLFATVGAWAFWRTKPNPPPKFALTILPPKGRPLPNTGSQIGAPLLSPDGKYVLAGVLLRDLDSPQMKPLTSLYGITGEAFWSSDSKWIGFPTLQGLQKINVPNGAPEPLHPGERAGPGPCRGTGWSGDDIIIDACLNGLEGAGLYFSVPGSAPRRVEVPGLPRQGRYYHPEFLPDSSDLLFEFRASDTEDGEIFLARLEGDKIIDPVRLMVNKTAAHYTPAGDGRLLYVRSDNLYAQRLDLKHRRLEGEPLLIQQGVASDPKDGLADFSVSRAGTVAWRPGTEASSQITIFDRQGNPTGTFGPPTSFGSARLSPDDTHLLAESEILERDQPGQLDLGKNRWSVWSADGSRVFGTLDSQIVERPVASGPIRVVADAPAVIALQDVSLDGKVALYRKRLESGAVSVVSLRLDTGDAKPIPLLDTGEDIGNARFSPDGRWVVYQVGSQLFVQPFPGPGLRKEVSGSGNYPIWQKDGKEVVFIRNGQFSTISVSVAGNELRFGRPVGLFPVPPAINIVGAFTPLDISRDGSFLVFPRSLQQPEDSNMIHIKSGWLDTQR